MSDDLKTLIALFASGSFGVLVFLLAMGIGSMVGSFAGAYLKSRGKSLALKADFDDISSQLRKNTDIVEAIKADQAIAAKAVDELYALNQFTRDLYAEPLRQFCAQQARALTQAYLMVCEPTSSEADCKDMILKGRLERASRVVMAPLHEHIGWVDPETERLIYNVNNKLLELVSKNEVAEGAMFKKEMFGLTERARTAVKIDKVAYRLGIISFPLIDRKEETS